MSCLRGYRVYVQFAASLLPRLTFPSLCSGPTVACLEPSTFILDLVQFISAGDSLSRQAVFLLSPRGAHNSPEPSPGLYTCHAGWSFKGVKIMRATFDSARPFHIGCPQWSCEKEKKQKNHAVMFRG